MSQRDPLAIREVNPAPSRVDPRAEPSEPPPSSEDEEITPVHRRSGTRSAQVPRGSMHPTPAPTAYPELAQLRRELQGDRVLQLEELVMRKERQITELADALRRANAEKTELLETNERLRRLVDKLSKLGP